MAQIDGAGQQDTDNKNTEALQAPLAKRKVTLSAHPQGGSDVPSHQNSDPVRRIGNSTLPLGSYRKTSCTVVPHRQSEPSRLSVSHTGRDRLKLPPSPTLLRAGHLRRKPARPCDRPDRRPRNGAVASGPRP